MTRFVVASTTTVCPLAQLMLKPKALAEATEFMAVCSCGSHKAVGMPSKVLPQPVVPGK